MFKFLHTADWQIGKQFGGFEPDDAAILADTRISGIRSIAAKAAEGSVDAVFVAGDVFDAQTVSDKTIQQAFRAMEAYPGPWLMLPGNHDAGLVESVWTRAQRLGALPDNVVLCLTPEPVSLQDGRVVVLPAPLTQRNTFNDLTEWFGSERTADGVIRIGLAHGSVQGVLPDTIDSANPIAPGRATESRLDYLGLGDWHGTKQIDDRTWYSGTHEQDRFRSHDAGNVLIVEVEAGRVPKVTVLPMGKHRWKEIDVDLVVASDVETLEQRLDALEGDDVVDLTLRGASDLAGHERIKQAVSRAQGRVRALRWDLAGMRLTPSPDDLARLRADGYLADVLQDLRATQGIGGEEGAMANDALVLLATTLREVSPTGAPA